MQRNLLVPCDVLTDLLAHAASAAQLVGDLDGSIAAAPSLAAETITDDELRALQRSGRP